MARDFSGLTLILTLITLTLPPVEEGGARLLREVLDEDLDVLVRAHLVKIGVRVRGRG